VRQQLTGFHVDPMNPVVINYTCRLKEVRTVRVQPGGWYPDDLDPSELPIQEPAPLNTSWRKLAGPPDRFPKPVRSPKLKKRKRKRKERF
jgi:hypothetical protein